MLEEQYDLPEDWSWATVADVISDAQTGFASGQKDVAGGMRHLRMNNIGADCRLNLDSVLTVPNELAKPRHLLQFNDVLVCHTNSVKLVGKAALFNLNNGPFAFSNHLTRLRVKPEVLDPQWLWQVLATLWRERYFENRCKQWVNQATIERETLLAAPIPIPPLPEQRRLVEKIERLFAESRTAREALDQVPPLLKRFRQAVLAKAFRGELTEHDPNDEPATALLERIRAERRRKWEENLQAKGKDPAKAKYVEPEPPDTSELQDLPEGWEWATVGHLAIVGTGATPLRSKKIYYQGGQIPWVTSSALNDDVVHTADEFITEIALKETNAKVFPKGTLLVAMYGEGQTRGRVSELGIEAATNQACASLVFSGRAADCKMFVKLFFRKSYEDIRLLSAGGVQPNLNLSMIRDTCIPVAPLAEQRRIIDAITQLFAQADSVEQALEAARRRVEKVDQAILARAFRGEL